MPTSFTESELRILDLAITFTFWLHKMRFGSSDTPAAVAAIQEKITAIRYPSLASPVEGDLRRNADPYKYV